MNIIQGMIGTNPNIKRRVWDMQYPIVGGGAVPRSCYFFLSFFSLISFLINSFMYLDLGIIPISLSNSFNSSSSIDIWIFFFIIIMFYLGGCLFNIVAI